MYGYLCDNALGTAARFRADLIVMGSHRNLPGEKPFIDSTVQKVLRESPCAVMSVNKDNKEPNWRTMLVPLSLNEGVHKSFGRVRDLARSLDSAVHLVHINLPDDFKETSFIEKQFAAFKEDYRDLRITSSSCDCTDVEEGILETIDRIKPDYIGMLTHDHRHRARYLVSTTETIFYRADLPVISFPLLEEMPASARAVTA